jgi:hypothetical protein
VLGFVPGGRDGGGGVEERARVAVVGAVLISGEERPEDGGREATWSCRGLHYQI